MEDLQEQIERLQDAMTDMEEKYQEELQDKDEYIRELEGIIEDVRKIID